MINSQKNIFKIILASSIIGCMGLSSVYAGDLKLRSSIDTISPEIQLKGGVQIDKRNQTISLSLRDSDLRQVIRMLADKAGYNIVLHDSVKGTVTVDLNKTPLNKAFEYILTLNKLSYWQDGNTLIITTADESSSLGLNKSKIKPIKIKYVDAGVIATFLNKNIFSINKPNGSSKPNVVINPNTNEIMIFGSDGDVALAQKVVKYLDVKPESRSYDINYAPVGDIANIICNSVFGSKGAAAALAAGGTATEENKIACESSTNAAITADNLESVNTKGFQVYYNDSLRKITIYGGTQEQISQVADTVKKFDKKQQQAYIEVSIIELSESGSKSLSSTWAYSDGRIAIDAGYTSAASGKAWSGLISSGLDQLGKATNPLTGEEEDVIAVPGGISWNGTSNGVSRVLGTSYGPDVVPRYVSSLRQAISALLTQKKGRLLANPRIIVTNNQKSTIDITSEYLDNKTVTTYVPTSGSTSFSTTYTKGSAGIKFDITPRITPNGYVYLDLNPSYIQPGESEYDSNGAKILTYANTRQFDLKNIRVKDGETLILGGLIQENESNSQQKIPLLADIPLVGMLFKSSSSDKTRSELIIMVTPKILKDSDAEDTL